MPHHKKINEIGMLEFIALHQREYFNICLIFAKAKKTIVPLIKQYNH